MRVGLIYFHQQRMGNEMIKNRMRHGIRWNRKQFVKNFREQDYTTMAAFFTSCLLLSQRISKSAKVTCGSSKVVHFVEVEA
jgi:hypothetical protein